MKEKIVEIIKESIRVKEGLIKTQIDKIDKVAQLVYSALKKKGKVILFGDGGSAADSQHIAAELIGRFKIERPPLKALALTVNTSILTALANDYGFEHTFSRQVEALGGEGDVAIAISTSGNSPNVIAATIKAKEMKIDTVGLIGGDGGKLFKIVDVAILIPSSDTPRIQEAHILVGHIICELVETLLFTSRSE